MLYVDACELADLVLWGQMSEDALFLNLQAQSMGAAEFAKWATKLDRLTVSN